MGRNVEIKAKITAEELPQIRSQVAEIASSGPFEIQQKDTFFHCDNGRLKLREFADSTAELIFYQRADDAGPKTSRFHISPCEPDSMRTLLGESNGVRGVVKKTRELFLIDQTRVHLDSVDGLGTFLELEVVLSDDQDQAWGLSVANEIISQLNIRQTSLIKEAYVDLLMDDAKSDFGKV